MKNMYMTYYDSQKESCATAADKIHPSHISSTLNALNLVHPNMTVCLPSNQLFSIVAYQERYPTSCWESQLCCL